MATTFEKVLIDASTNHRSEEWSVDSSEFRSSGKPLPFFSADFFRLQGGLQDGVDLLQIDNGCFNFVVVPTRGMGILEGECHGVRLGWDSPVEEVVHPSHINLRERNGAGWLEGFNEWIVRCGLASNGAPYVDEDGRAWTLHGRIANTPASMVAVHIELEAPYRIRIVGMVRETCMFQSNFLLQTEILTQAGADWIQLTDRVVNLRAVPDRMAMLYHCNYGTPLMGEGARLLIPASMAMPRDHGYSRESIKGWDRELAPTAGISEECWYVVPKADRKGMTRQMLVNSEGTVGVVQEYAHRALPCFAFWKNPAALEDGYVTGLEPSTNYPNPTWYEHAQKRTMPIRPGKCWESCMRISLKEGKKAIVAEEKKIRAIQGSKKTEVLSAPIKGFSIPGESKEG